jgi:UDP-N-acetylmuramoyl-tripeptide--D-alanyl-D-alanine ligase
VEELYYTYLRSLGINTDTRSISEGQVFFALKGANFNGNLYAHQALEKGAYYAVVDELHGEPDERILVVEDSLKTLQELATHHRRQLKAQILGITGSNGKTTTKELLNAAIGDQRRVFVTPGNFNNHIGVPLTLLQIPVACEYAIVELGDNHRGEIDFLCRIAEPNLGYITNLGKDHIEGFGSYANNVLSKKELFDYLNEEGRACLVNDFDPELSGMIGDVVNPHSMKEFSEEHNVRLVGQNPFLQFSLDGAHYTTKLIGDYNFENILACLFISAHFGLDLVRAAESICNYEASNNRSEFRISEKGNRIFLDAYNANPSSMELAVRSFLATEDSGKSCLILGDMLELGDLSSEEHQSMVDFLEARHFRQVVLVGSEFGKCAVDNALQFPSYEEANAYLRTQGITDSSILIKGSRGIRLENCLAEL